MPSKLLTAFIFCAALLHSAAAQQSNPGAKTWAVVIGVSKYQKLPGGQQLQFADRDAALFAEAIQKRGVNSQNVRLLTGPDATTAAIKSAVGNWLARSISQQDTVLIFFSGHGYFEKEFAESYLLGYDSDPKDAYGTALSLTELGQALSKRVHSSRVLIVADAMRRDFFDPDTDANSSRLFGLAFDQLTASRPGVFAVLASGPGEFSREGQRWTGHGVFAKHLADVLLDGADRNGDLAIAADDLFDLLKGRVADDTAGKQHPWRSGGFSRTEVARSDRISSTAPMATPEIKRLPAETPVISPKAEDKKQTQKVPETSSRNTVEERQSASRKDKARPNASSGSNSQPPVTSADRAASPPTDVKEKNPDKAAAKDRATGSSRTEINTRPGAAEAPLKKEDLTPALEKIAVTNNKESVSAPSVKPAATPRLTPPPRTNIKSQPPSTTSHEVARAEISVHEPGAPPRPVSGVPSAVVVSSDRVVNEPETVTANVPSTRAEGAPSPLVLQLEAAITSRSLIEPRNTNAWDLYQRMLAEPGAAADAARLKPVLVTALIAQGRALVTGDIRVDNVTDKVDDFKRAGQMFARARSLAMETGEITALEKLSAAGALISLQFYDEAERALAPLQNARLAAVENALGLVYQGKLDSWRAERAFKKASELDPKWAAPHYNLAQLYKSQQNQAAITEFEIAASADPTNASLLTALGDEHFTKQQWKQAADAFRKAIALRPSDDNLHTKLGHALYSQGLQDEANREYQKAQELRRKQ